MTTEIRDRALRFLARREYSKTELFERLTREGCEPDAVREVLAELEKEGLLSDERYVEQILNARIGRYGRQHILKELSEKGISHELAGRAREKIDEAEQDALKSVWERKFGKKPQDRKELAKQVRFLQGRGFSLDEIFRVIENIET
ncbi:MAG: regulatory protein RecX [Burkholderiales bacterium]|nr:regulatory protein RecX [Burkholderiales bacterium]